MGILGSPFRFVGAIPLWVSVSIGGIFDFDAGPTPEVVSVFLVGPATEFFKWLGLGALGTSLHTVNISVVMELANVRLTRSRKDHPDDAIEDCPGSDVGIAGESVAVPC